MKAADLKFDPLFPVSSHTIDLREGTVVETKATLKVARTGVKRVLVYSKIENGTLCSLPWTQVVNFMSKGTIFCRYVPATAVSTVNYRVHP